MTVPTPAGPFAPGDPSPPGGRHPSGLVDAERGYLIRWGAREAALAAVVSLGVGAASAVLAALVSPFWLLLLVPAIPAAALGVLFFRNPRRRVPTDPGLFLAPADGHVVEVVSAEEKEYIGGPAWKIGIFLSIFDVHLNRAPCSGRVEFLRHRDGLYLDARNPRSSRENECQAIGILRGEEGPPGVKVLVRQISGAIARRIVCPLDAGDQVERGRLIGMIKYGSRTELFVAVRSGDPEIEVLVKPGDKVRAGETPLLRYVVPGGR